MMYDVLGTFLIVAERQFVLVPTVQ